MFQSSSRTQPFLQRSHIQDDPFLRPGLGLPLDFAPMEQNIYGVQNRSLFPNSNDDRDIKQGNVDQPIQTIRELNMLVAMEDITDIPDWYKLIREDDIAERWKAESMQKGLDITPNMADWIIDELRFKAVIYERTGSLALYNGDITKSDINVPEEVRLKFQEACAVLESAPREMRFFKPGTDYRQEDLIPIEFCSLVYGRSRVMTDELVSLDDALDYAGKGEIIAVPDETGITREDMAWRVASQADVRTRPFSRRFQLLPCEMQLGEDNKWHITSYINNLHPIKYRDMYNLIEETFNMIIPQLNATLTPLKDMLHSRARIEYKKAEYYPLPRDVAEQEPRPMEHEPQIEFEDRQREWQLKHWKAIQPDCQKFIPWAVPQWMLSELPLNLATPIRVEHEVDLNKEYSRYGLQVIVRLTNIEMTPEMPKYETGWHGAGNMNEHVCASTFYIISAENTTMPIMGFRHITESSSLAEVERDGEDTIWMQQVFRKDVGDPAVQESGRIRCVPGRTIMFPSTVQHRIELVELLDKSKPGTLKAVSFFLVDPNIRIISTANVPPQRLDWAFDEADVNEMQGLNESLDKLSMGFKDRRLALPFSMNEAKRLHTKAFSEMIEFTKYTSVAFDSNLISI